MSPADRRERERRQLARRLDDLAVVADRPPPPAERVGMSRRHRPSAMGVPVIQFAVGSKPTIVTAPRAIRPFRRHRLVAGRSQGSARRSASPDRAGRSVASFGDLAEQRDERRRVRRPWWSSGDRAGGRRGMPTGWPDRPSRRRSRAGRHRRPSRAVRRSGRWSSCAESMSCQISRSSAPHASTRFGQVGDIEADGQRA